MTRASKSKPRRKGMVSEGERRESTDALNQWLAQREGPSKELQAKQTRLLKILAKRALH